MGLGPDVNYLLGYLPGIVLTGAGAGIGQTGFIAGGTAALPSHQYATGAGIINTSRQIGAAMGVAVFVATSGSALQSVQYQIPWLLMAGFGLIAACSATLLSEKKSHSSTQ